MTSTSSRSLATRQTLMVVLLFAGYAAYYFCRADLSVGLPMLAAELKDYGIAPNVIMIRLGSMASLGVVAYAVGKFVLAGLGDVWGGRASFLIGLAGAVLFTLLFAAGGSLPLFTLAWIANRFIQSMGWAGAVKVCSRWFSYRSYGVIVGILSLSYLVGDAAAREWMAVLIAKGYGWRTLFYLAAGVAGAALAANFLLLKNRRTELGFSEPAANPLNVFGAAEEKSGSWSAMIRPLLSDGGFLLVCFLSFCTTIVRETFNTWTPTYLHNFFGYSTSVAASTSAVFPAAGAVSVLAAGLIGDRLGVCGRSIVFSCGLAIATLGLILLTVLRPGMNPALPWILIGVVALGLLGPYSYLAGAMALDFGGKRGGATSSGFIDGVGYVGGILAGDSVARVSVYFGWSGVFGALAALSAASVAAAGVLYLRQRRQIQED